MLKNTLPAILVVFFIIVPGINADSKSEWTDPGAIQFAEDFYFLVETILKNAAPDVKVAFDSHPVSVGTLRILEFRFPDDKIITIKIHRDIQEEDTVWLKPISKLESYFEKIR